MALYKLMESKDNRFLLFVFLLIVVFFVLVYPKIKNNDVEEKFQTSLDKCKKIDLLICSPKCAASGQFPVSFNTGDDPRIKEEDIGTKWFTTNMPCTGKHGQGGVCMHRTAYDNLRKRGSNAI